MINFFKLSLQITSIINIHISPPMEHENMKYFETKCSTKLEIFIKIFLCYKNISIQVRSSIHSRCEWVKPLTLGVPLESNVCFSHTNMGIKRKIRKIFDEELLFGF